jgi:hypothetical protein
MVTRTGWHREHCLDECPRMWRGSVAWFDLFSESSEGPMFAMNWIARIGPRPRLHRLLYRA